MRFVFDKMIANPPQARPFVVITGMITKDKGDEVLGTRLWIFFSPNQIHKFLMSYGRYIQQGDQVALEAAMTELDTKQFDPTAEMVELRGPAAEAFISMMEVEEEDDAPPYYN